MTCSRQKVTGEMFENFYRQIMADGFDEKTADNLPDRKFKNFDLFCPLPAGSVNWFGTDSQPKKIHRNFGGTPGRAYRPRKDLSFYWIYCL